MNPSQLEENPSHADRSLKDFGQKIREKRIANNLSLESVSGHLHISVKILEAIEDGTPEKGPTPVFFRGLVRTYCHFLELDKIEFIDPFEKKLRSIGEEEKINVNSLKPVFNVRDSFPIRNLLTFFVILFGGSILYYLYLNQTNINNNSDNITKIKSENLEILNENENRQNIPKKVKNYVYKDTKKIYESTETKSPSLLKKQKENIISPSTTTENFEPLTLEVEASKGTWISLAIDNSLTKDFRIDTDEIKQWIAKENFVLTIGNTKVVRVLLNGREIETNRTHDLLINWLVDSKYLP